MKQRRRNTGPQSSSKPEAIGFSFQEDLWFGDFDDEAARGAAASSMAAMAGRIMGARPFPAAAQKLVQLTRNENTNIMKVVRVLESDPGLSQRVLRLVNSAGYGLRVRCTSLNHATALLGQQRLQQIATSAVLLNHFGRTSDETKRKQEHGALVASLCRYLAIHLGLPQEDLFTCGLLHDLGQLMMLDEGEKGYRELVLEHEGSWDSLHVAEREVMGFDHAVLAAHVLASWSIPAPVPEVIALHHQPALAHQRGPKISAMVQTLRFADHMAHLLETSSQKEGSKILADCEAASYLGFSEMQISAMWNDLKQLHQANLSRRMDIADIAPRSVSVPASLSPRAISITDAPTGFSEAPPSIVFSGTKDSALSRDRSEANNDSLAPDSMGFTHSERMPLQQATPVYVPPNSAPFDDSANVPPSGNSDGERVSEINAAPEIFPCAMCYGPTFGAKCPVCAAHVCTNHQTEGQQWCVACEDEFRRYKASQQVPELLKIAVIASLAVAVPSAYLLLGFESALGTLGMFVTSWIAGYAAHQGLVKARFKRQRLGIAETALEQTEFDGSGVSTIPPGPESASEYARSLLQQELEDQQLAERKAREELEEEEAVRVEALEQEALVGNPISARASLAGLLHPSRAPENPYSWPPTNHAAHSWPPSQRSQNSRPPSAPTPIVNGSVDSTSGSVDPPPAVLTQPAPAEVEEDGLSQDQLLLEPTSQRAIAPPAPDEETESERSAKSEPMAEAPADSERESMPVEESRADSKSESRDDLSGAGPNSNPDPESRKSANTGAAEQEPASADEPVAVHDSSSAHEPIAEQEPASADEPVAVHDSSSAHEPVAEREPGSADEPVAVHDSSSAHEPVAVHDSSSAHEPVAEHDSTSKDEPIAAEAPLAADEPVRTLASETEEDAVEVTEPAAEPEQDAPAMPATESIAASKPPEQRRSTRPPRSGRAQSSGKRPSIEPMVLPQFPPSITPSPISETPSLTQKAPLLSEAEVDDWANAGSFRPPASSAASQQLGYPEPEEVKERAASQLDSEAVVCDAPLETVVITSPPKILPPSVCSNTGASLVQILPLNPHLDPASSRAQNDQARRVSGQ